MHLIFFTLGILTGSFLLFLIQPMFSKFVLPSLGGAPSVWNTLMLFFQSILLLGYLYAHLSIKWLGVKRQGALHGAILLLSLLAFPMFSSISTPPTENEMPIYWLLTQAFFMVGVPFFVLSTNAPLIQTYFSYSKHKNAHDPYFLYASSNAGSLIALLAYPFFIEPNWSLNIQEKFYTYAYYGFVALSLFCIFITFKNYKNTEEQQTSKKEIENIPLKKYAWWVFLAFIPSSLLIGVTTYISTDIAAVPLLWVIPLALYLLTFIIAFAKRQILPLQWQIKIATGLLFFLLVFSMVSFYAITFAILLHLILFFILSLICHTRLANERPHSKHLTSFYLCLSIGGVLGGVFNALIAPTLFNGPYEYAITIALALLCFPWEKTKFVKTNYIIDFLLPAFVVGVIFMHYISLKTDWGELYIPSDTMTKATSAVFLIFMFLIFSRGRPIRLSLGTAGVLLFFMILPQLSPNFEKAERSFFGTYQVRFNDKAISYELWSGSNATYQGRQSLKEDMRLSTLFFYPLEDIREKLPQKIWQEPMGVIGLGVGTIACLGGNEKQEITFYEIDPIVKNIAEDESYFTFLSDCPAKSKVVLGDGRLSIAKEEDNKFGMIVLDAFSYMSVPAHLITTQAVDLYLRKLKDDGVILMNVTNFHLDLKPLVASIAKHFNLKIYIRNEYGKKDRGAVWLIMARKEKHLGDLINSKFWEKLPQQKEIRVWTDNYSNILSLIKYSIFK